MKEYYRITRKDDQFKVKQISVDTFRSLKGKLNKNDLVISNQQSFYSDLQKINNIKGKTTKVRAFITLMNRIFKNYEEHYPIWLDYITIPKTHVNEKFALAITKDFIKCVASNGQRSSSSRVLIPSIVLYQWWDMIGDSILYKDTNPEAYAFWLEKADKLYKSQLNSYLNMFTNKGLKR